MQHVIVGIERDQTESEIKKNHTHTYRPINEESRPVVKINLRINLNSKIIKIDNY